MTGRPTHFDAGRPHLSGPIRKIARPLGRWARPIAGTSRFPLYAILRHTGRTSGKLYSTPVVGLRTHDGFVIPLPFGDATQWARNLFASGQGELRHAGVDYRIGEPRVVGRDAAEANLPAIARFVANRLGLRQYVLVRRM